MLAGDAANRWPNGCRGREAAHELDGRGGLPLYGTAGKNAPKGEASPDVYARRFTDGDCNGALAVGCLAAGAVRPC